MSSLRYLLLFGLILPSAGFADSFVVSNGDDTGSGSLRAALAAAEGTPGEDTITFDAGLSGGEVLIESVLDITAAGRILVTAESLDSPVTITSFGLDRIFHVGTGVELEMRDLTIADGFAEWGANGDAGDAPGNGGAGQNGGAIYNEGILILKRCTVENSTAGNGGSGGDKTDASMASSGNGGAGGHGGGIYSTGVGASVYLEDCLVQQNDAGSGGGAGDLTTGAAGTIGTAGKGGDGGGIYCDGGSLELVRTVVQANDAGAGGSGGGHGDSGVGGPGGAGGNGGGIALAGTAVFVVDSTIQNNSGGFGGPGGDFTGSGDTGGEGGPGGDGGGMWINGFAVAAPVHLRGSLIRGNDAGNGRSGGSAPFLETGLTGSNGGAGGDGGGLFVIGGADAVWMMENTTVYQNFAGIGGAGGDGSSGGTGGDGGDAGKGGGIAFSRNGVDYTADLTHVTILSNLAGFAGAGGTPSGSSNGESSSGGGIWEFPGGLNGGNGVTLRNSVVASNEAVTANNVASFNAEGVNFTAGNPQVGSLQDNGGATLTVAPNLGSPLLDGGGVLASPLDADQRGEVRPFNGVADLGAFEAKFQPDARIGVSSNPDTHRIDNVYTATGAGQTQLVKLSGSRTSNFHVSVENDGEIADDLRFSGSRANSTLRLSAFRITGGVQNITAQLVAGHLFEELPVGDVALVKVSVKAKSKKKRARQTLSYTVNSSIDTLVDRVVARVKQKRSR
ncbi:MAG: hypothetical protein KDN18_16625 [Verrucomicrobiae bacterium]|nr:hypothetical protein [Verrucomicrobiae bacterium]